MRETMEEALIADNRLYSRWRPWNDVTIETWLLPENLWHIRIHRIATPRALSTIEGGFAIERADFNADRSDAGEGRAVWYGQTDVSAIVDLSPDPRAGHAMSPIPNTNLIHAKTLLPQLRGQIGPGTTVLVTAAMALPSRENWAQALDNPPACPRLEEVERLFRENGERVPAFALQS